MNYLLIVLAIIAVVIAPVWATTNIGKNWPAGVQLCINVAVIAVAGIAAGYLMVKCLTLFMWLFASLPAPSYVV